MDIILWVAQVLLAIGFVFVGFNHATRSQLMATMPNMEWITAVPAPLMIFIGISEMAGAVGVVLPALTGILPWLTPWAATGLALVMLFAIVFHVSRKEYTNLLGNAVLLALAAFVTYGRFVLLSF
jgi:uncharacterized membrane protein YphA (DoxX/SURF4 family)